MTFSYSCFQTAKEENNNPVTGTVTGQQDTCISKDNIYLFVCLFLKSRVLQSLD